MNAQYPPGKHVIPMTHELEVGAVVPRDVLESIGECLALRKELLEVAEAAGHGLAAYVDDPGIGQNEVNQPDVPEVVRHLVDEARPARSPIGTGVAQVLLTEAAAVGRGQ